MTQHILKNRNFWQKTIEWFEKVGMARAMHELRRHNNYIRTFEELHKLSDKELTDIGISRSDIRSISAETYYDNR